MHWYTSKGEPKHFIIGANGKERATNLGDARKLNLFPSYTGIADQLSKPGLDNWFQNKLLYAALTLPRPEGISDDEFLKIVRQDASDEAEQAKLRGNEIHDCLEMLVLDDMTKEFDADVHEIARVALLESLRYCKSHRQDFIPEKTFASPLGYGGMVDLHNSEWLIDYKTKDITDKQWETYNLSVEEEKYALAAKRAGIAYPNNCQQLVVYDRGLGSSGRRLVNVYIDRQIPGRVIIHEWEGDIIDKEFQKFMCLLNHWQIDKGYTPEYSDE